jgi:RNA polymerase sigma-70 factor (sigma-E family)
MSEAADFVAFAQGNAAGLRRTAYILCRDWHLAEDLTQAALARLYVVWRRLDWSSSPQAYVRQILYREFLHHRGLRRSHEVITATPPERGRESSADLRMTMLDALGHLAPRDRAIVVLRYWEDLSIETVASTLGIKPSVVKTQCARSLARLRALLGEERFALFS